MGLSGNIADRLLFASDASRRRPTQIEFANAAARACSAGKNAVLHGPTGIGKTRALLAAGIHHVLRGKENKAVYGVRTLGQLFQVDAEFMRGWASAASEQAHGYDGIRFGLALGVDPMQKKICIGNVDGLVGDGLEHDCGGCPRQSARHSRCAIKGGCTVGDYVRAAKQGLCPYAYMRANLVRSNLIVASTGYVNSRRNMQRIFANEKEQKAAVLFIDEAHSYLDTLGTNPMLHLGFTGGSTLSEVRQPDSEVDLTGVREAYAVKVSDALANTAFQEEAKETLGIQTRQVRHLKGAIGMERAGARSCASVVRHQSRLVRGNRKAIVRGQRVDLDRLHADAHAIDPFGSTWPALMIRMAEATLEIARWKQTEKPVTRSLTKVQRTLTELRRIEERLDRQVAGLQGSVEEAETAFEDAKKVASRAEERLASTEREFARACKAVARCREARDFVNLDRRKAQRSELFEARHARGKEVGRSRRTRARAEGRLRKVEGQLEYKSALLPKIRRRVGIAEGMESALERSISDIDDRRQDAIARRDETGEAIDAAIERLESIRTMAVDRMESLKELGTRVRGTCEATAAVLGVGGTGRDESGQERHEPAPMTSKAVQGLALLDFVAEWCAKATRMEGEARRGADVASSGLIALKEVHKNLHSSHSAWIGSLLDTMSVIVGATTNPHRYFVTVPKSKTKQRSAEDVLITDLDLGGKLRLLTGPYRSVILASGTLKPVGLTAELLGWDGAVAESFASPFRDGNYQCYAIVGVNSGVDARGQRLTAMERTLLHASVPEMVSAIGRNTGVFVASESLLKDVYPKLRAAPGWPSNSRHLVLSQGNKDLPDDYGELAADAGCSPRKALGPDGDWQEILKGGTSKQVVVWMASAGKFSEGIDFPGTMLQAAILIGIPFPYQMDLKELIAARTAYYERKGGAELGKAAHELAYFVFAFRKLAQAAGRIHRRVDDTGCIVFMDERLLGLKYDPRTRRLGNNRSIEANRRSLEILPEQVVRRMAVVVPQSLHAARQRIEQRISDVLPSAPLIGSSEAIEYIRAGTHPLDRADNGCASH